MIPVGIFSIKQDDKVAQVLMDYVVPRYRDGQFGFTMYVKKVYVFRDLGITKFEAFTRVPSHADYLKKMGFVVVKDEDSEEKRIHLVKKLNE